MPAIGFINAKASSRKSALVEGGVLSAADAAFISTGDQMQSIEATVTVTELNAGKVLVRPSAGNPRVTGLLMVFTGAVTGVTDIRISDTATPTPVDVVTVAVAGATAGARISEASTSNVTWGTFGAPLTANQGIQIRKTGGTAAGGPVFVRLDYKIS
jgi:hypothetical protein